MGVVRIVTLGIGLLLMIPNVNSSATCVEKFLDGQTAETKHVVTVGERVTLRCDVTARDPNKDMVYWKLVDEVMSQDDTVIPKYQSKFNVTLEPNLNGGGKDIYTISWIAELDDAGKYNCTCTTGGIQYPVWIKRPCNNRHHIIDTTAASTKSNSTTSVEVLDFLSTRNSYKLEAGKSLIFSVALDCNCTWPEVNRTFIGKWYRDCTDDPHTNCAKDTLPCQLAPVTGIQDSSITPIGCYTGKGSVTYRYRNVFGSLTSVVFKCTRAMMGKTFNFYIDEGETMRPEEYSTIMSFHCKESRDVDVLEYNKTKKILNVMSDVCQPKTVYYKDFLLGSTFREADISQMAQFRNTSSSSHFQIFRCLIPGIYRLISGKETLYEIHCAIVCPQSIRAVEIGLIVSGIVSLIGIFAAIAIYCIERQAPNNDSLLQGRKKYTFITCIALIIIESLVCISDIALVIQMNAYCAGMSGMNYQISRVGIGTGIVLTLAVVVVIVCSVCLHMCTERRSPSQEVDQVQANDNFQASVSDITQITNLSSLPPEQRQPFTRQNTIPDQGNTNLPSGSIELNSYLADQDFDDEYENVPYENIDENVPYESIDNFYTPLSTPQLEKELCMKCSKNSIQVYFKPCRHAAVCTSCAMSMLDNSSEASRPAVCPECNKLVTNYQKM